MSHTKNLQTEQGKLHTIKNDKFGLLGSMNTSKESLFPFFEQLLLGIL